MFRSLHMKLVMIMLLLVTSLMAVVGAFLMTSVTNFYIDDFYEQMSEVFGESNAAFVSSLREEAAQEDGAARLQTMLEAYDGEAGLAMAREKKPDLILLDVMMPKMMGFDVCRALRAEGDNVPVIILTAREEEEDKILGLEIGADDYITKPFSMRELLARVKANIRRTTMLSAPAAEDNAMSAGGGITINTDSFQVRKNGVPIDLTQREYELLTFLASHPGKVFSRVDLMEQVWNYGYVGDDARTVDVTVRRLREKIEDNPAAPAYILTRRGVGYYFSAQA